MRGDSGEQRPTADERSRARYQGVVQVACAVVLVCLLSACTPILMVGDSITAGAKASLGPELTSAGWSADIDGVVGRTTAQGLAVVRAKRGDTGYFVIDLGYNDAGNTTVYRDRLFAILGELRAAKTVWVVNLNESRSYYATANQIIGVAPFWYPNVRVIDWASVARANPGAIQPDGVHLTGAGSYLYALTVSRAIGSAPS
jgi:hypothetical protein